MSIFEISDDVAQHLIKLRGRVHAYEEYDPATTALLVVDMQNYFLDETEQACCAAARGIVPNINLLAHEMRLAGGMVVWIKTQARPEIRDTWNNFLELYQESTRAKRFASLTPGGSGFDLWRDLDVKPDDEIIIKTHYSAFIQGSSKVEELLRAHHIETVLVAGTVTNVCCDSTARDAMMRGFRTIMVADANAAFNQQDHIFALDTFIRVFGDVHSTHKIIEKLKARQTGTRSVG